MTTIASPRLKFGLMAKDKVTGFSGIVCAYSAHLTGCDQWCLIPKSKKGEAQNVTWFDESRLIFGKRALDDLDAPAPGKTSPSNGAIGVPPTQRTYGR